MKRTGKYQQRNQPLVILGYVFKQKRTIWLLSNQFFTKRAARKNSGTNLYASHLLHFFKSGTANKTSKYFPVLTVFLHYIYPKPIRPAAKTYLLFFPKAWMAFTSMLSLVITPSVVQESQNYLASLLHFHDKDGGNGVGGKSCFPWPSFQ